MTIVLDTSDFTKMFKIYQIATIFIILTTNTISKPITG